ncbi:MAG: hypothetical protein PWQ51_242 [Methanolobus sp.]|jgi:hypothetical protein|nr:hypothetical protein [Methanolobus sp.]MDK2830382.1 hypothetical protein [Methanolobus sp.]MDK2938078.1 hypothetical protein [Methanolobus sp.]
MINSFRTSTCRYRVTIISIESLKTIKSKLITMKVLKSLIISLVISLLVTIIVTQALEDTIYFSLFIGIPCGLIVFMLSFISLGR